MPATYDLARYDIDPYDAEPLRWGYDRQLYDAGPGYDYGPNRMGYDCGLYDEALYDSWPRGGYDVARYDVDNYSDSMTVRPHWTHIPNEVLQRRVHYTAATQEWLQRRPHWTSTSEILVRRVHWTNVWREYLVRHQHYTQQYPEAVAFSEAPALGGDSVGGVDGAGIVTTQYLSQFEQMIKGRLQ